MTHFLKESKSRGFTIVELLIVIIVIAILATLGVVAYNGVTNSARDKAVLSDSEGVASEVVRYATNNSGQYGTAVQWYSGGVSNANIQFEPSEGTIIDVTASASAYCVRAYNPSATTYTNLYTAAIKESNEGDCDNLIPSTAAVTANNGAGGNLVKSISVSDNSFVCALAMKGTGYCWGDGYVGQLGNGTMEPSSVPVSVVMSGDLNGKIIKRLETAGKSGQFTCALASDDKLYCWGANNYGQLGIGNTSDTSSPTAVVSSGALSGKTIVDFDLGASFVCAIASDLKPYCWGNGYSSSVPVAINTSGVLAGKSLKDITAASSGVCGTATDDKLYCWNNAYISGDGTGVASTTPSAVSMSGVLAGKTIKKIAADEGAFVCVIASDNKPYCWGSNSYGALGAAGTTLSYLPIAVDTTGVLANKTIVSLSTETNHVCALDSDGKAYCWGNNGSGRLGNNSTTNSSVPVAVYTGGALANKVIKKIEASPSRACVITSDGMAYCWGAGTALGSGSSAASSVPVPVVSSGVLSGKTILTMTGRGSVECAIASDRLAYCWGANGVGQLGNGGTTTSYTPVAVIPFGS